jgi:hypothetical protein
MQRDPRDIGTPLEKEWEEFRAGYAAALLLVWLIRENKESVVGYAKDLQERFEIARDVQESLLHENGEPERERGFPLPPVGGMASEEWASNLTWFDDAQATALYDQLFPHVGGTRDFAETTARMALVALYASLEAYASSLGIATHGLPSQIEGFLIGRRMAHHLDSRTMHLLIDCAATRNIIVHNRGIVNDKYVRAVPGPAFQIGEVRLISDDDLRNFSKIIWNIACSIRIAAQANAD